MMKDLSVHGSATLTTENAKIDTDSSEQHLVAHLNGKRFLFHCQVNNNDYLDYVAIAKLLLKLQNRHRRSVSPRLHYCNWVT